MKATVEPTTSPWFFSWKEEQMNIKKVDDKPMVIHTKEKMRINKHGNGENPKNEELKIQESHKRISELRQLYQKNDSWSDAKKSIKSKSSSINLAGVTGAKVATDQMEGGEEVQRASGIAYGVARTSSSGIKKGASVYRKGALVVKKRRLKRFKREKSLRKNGLTRR